jgi:alpha-tubulin suppressor-like RCC1 family protein
MSGLTGFKISGGTDLSYLFQPYSSGTAAATGYKVNGKDLSGIFQPYTSGTQAVLTGYKITGGGDLNSVFNKQNIVRFWGINDLGQLGNGNLNTTAAPSTLNYYTTPTPITGLSNVSSIYMGQRNGLMIDTNKKVLFWGLNSHGQLGNNNPNSASTAFPFYNCYMSPTQVTDVSNITTINCTLYFCLAIDTDKNVWFWGTNVNGSLGVGNANANTTPTTNGYYMKPTRITDLSNITAIDSYSTGALGLDTNKNVWFWGRNSFGQLGNGNANTTAAPSTLNYYMKPTRITDLSNINAIVYSYAGCFSLDTIGNVWYCGLNSTGMLGNNNPNTTSTVFTYYNCYMKPTIITDLSNISSIKATNFGFGCLAF